MAGVRITDLTVRFGSQAVIPGLSLEVHEGEFLVLLGPSGCGKSTLLHAIAGLNDISAGRIEIGGRDMTGADPAERGIGMVFQSYALYPTMTVERNLSFGLRVAGLPAAEIARRVQHAASLLQLAPLLQRKPAQLSGGQRQRVAIGRALVRQAGVYLFDEPLSNLDAQLRAELRRELKLLHQQLGSTMVYVTHDQSEALTLASRIVVMRGGVIQQIGTPAQVYAQPDHLFVAGFLGSPAINRIEGRLSCAAGRVRFFGGPRVWELPALALRTAVQDGQPAILAFRAEHVQVTRHAGDPDGTETSVQVVEPQGSHQILWLRLGDGLVASSVDAAMAIAVGQHLHWTIRPEGLLLFDPTTGQRL